MYPIRHMVLGEHASMNSRRGALLESGTQRMHRRPRLGERVHQPEVLVKKSCPTPLTMQPEILP